ncbi:MAG: hypothetical protein OEY43_08360, partial [Gammaproteobacteria bacterium]|nr:hypothetical protein [Gammaproteobacteria bacterium]
MKLWNLVFLATAIIYSTNTFAASTIWDYSNGVAYDRTNDWAGFNALQGDIQHIDNGVAGGSFGLWGADSNTLTNYQGSYSHTFDGTIADISGYNYDRAFVTLTNGEIW